MKKHATLCLLFLCLAAAHSCSKAPTEDDFNPNKFIFTGDESTFYLPMAITPNGDNLNDTYRLIHVSATGATDQVSEFKLEIRDKNKKIFSTVNTDFGWTGVDESGIPVTGAFRVNLRLGINGGATKKYDTWVRVIRDGCVPKEMASYVFSDMVDARYGVVYETQEQFCP